MDNATPRDSRTGATAHLAPAASERATRLMFGLAAVGVLTGVALLTRPQASSAASSPEGASMVARAGAARLASRHVPAYTLPTPSRGMFDGAGLGGHTGIPVPPERDEQGRASLGIIVGPSLFVWVYGGADGVRYTVADLQGQVLAGGLTGDEVYGLFPEVNLPEMEFGSDGQLCEPLMWADIPDGLE